MEVKRVWFWVQFWFSSSRLMVWTEIKLPFNPPLLHMTSLWCTSRCPSSLAHHMFSSVTCSQSELLGSASASTGQPVVGEREVPMNGSMEEKGQTQIRTLTASSPFHLSLRHIWSAAFLHLCSFLYQVIRSSRSFSITLINPGRFCYLTLIWTG